MATIIIYLEDDTYIDRTIDDLLDKTPPSLIEQIIICDDSGLGYKRDDVTVLETEKVGRAVAWNKAASTISDGHLIFLRQTTKFSENWLTPIISALEADRDVIISPSIYGLDTNLWSSDGSLVTSFGWRWNLKQYYRSSRSKYSPSVSSMALAINKKWLVELGGFDDNMGPGDGESLELSIRCWLFGGSARTLKDSAISVSVTPNENLSNLARIVEVWFPGFASGFYQSRGIKPEDLEIGRLDNLHDLQEKQQITGDGYLSAQMPELLSVYALRGSASGKTVAVIGNGPSVDVINPAMIYRYDIIIAVDYVGSLFDCDYVLTRNAEVLTQMMERYKDSQILLPTLVDSKTAGNLVDAKSIAQDALIFEQAEENYPKIDLDPPFANFGSPVHPAVHFALFLGASSVTLFGCDNKIINGRSHSSKIKYYDGGELWTDSEATRRRFAGFEYGLDRLGKLAADVGIPLLRMNHA